MNLFRRGYLSVVRRPFKSILLLLTIFMLGNLIVGSFITNRSIDVLEKTFKEKVGALATIKSNIQSPQDENYLGDPLRINAVHDDLVGILEEIRKIEGVSSVDYRTWTSLNFFNTFDLVEESNCVSKRMCHSTSYSGVSSVVFKELLSEKIELSSGRLFNERDLVKGLPVGIISDSSTLLFENRVIEVGDKIPYHILAYDQSRIHDDEIPIYDEKTIEIEIIGKYKTNDMVDSINHIDSIMDLERHLFVPARLLYEVRDTLKSMYLEAKGPFFGEVYHGAISVDNILIHLKSVDEIPSISDQIDRLLSDSPIGEAGYELITSDKDFAKIMGPVMSMKQMSTVTFYVSLSLSVIILSLVIVMLLRDRKHEIGIYMALGEMRSKVVLQIVFELMIISLVAVSLALYSGKTVTQRYLSLPELRGESHLISSDAGEAVVSGFKVAIDMNDIVVIYLIMFGTVLLSSVVPTVYILRVNPKKVLM